MKKNSSFLKEIKEDCLKISERDDVGRDWSQNNYYQGYTSYSSIANLHELNSTFINLRKKIDSQVKKYAKKLGLELSEELQMQSCWMNIMPPGSSHSLHLHPLSIISGTVYIDVPKGSGNIKFEDPRLSKMMNCPPRKDAYHSGAFASLKPVVGDLILFESWLRHEVEINKGKANRISISFNYS